MNDFHKQAFIEEALDLLGQLEISLLELEKNPDDSEIIAKVFRALHTIKGSSGMFGYDEITMFTHDIETVYHLIRNGEIRITKEIIDITLAARDQINLMLHSTESRNLSDQNVTGQLLSAFRSIVNEHKNKNSAEPAVDKKQEKKKESEAKAEKKLFYVSFVPGEDILLTGTNPILLIREIFELGEFIIVPDYTAIPSFNELNPEKCYLRWEILVKTAKGIDAIKDVFIFVDDSCKIDIKEIEDKKALREESGFNALADFISQNNASLMNGIEVFTLELEKQAAESKAKTPARKGKEGVESAVEAEGVSSIRVSSDKLDVLVNLVGELVTLQARLSQIAQKNSEPAIVSVAEEVERITWSLRDSALNIRMLTIGSTFSKFNRLVRDLSRELGKEVELTTEGADTELDKTVIDKLNDPLVHIIRNSIDHGVEDPALREKAGKPRQGKIHLSASHSGGNVLITISDDGAGINKEAVLEKAKAGGLVPQNAELTDSEIYALIFGAGFSTARTVTNVSGRGVGMDVVRRAVESIRGSIEVKSTEGEGTTITLKLPLTLAIIDGLLVVINDEHFILPLSSVEECIELSKADIEASHGRHIVNVRGEIIPYIYLRERFLISENKPEIEQVVIANVKGNRTGFVVDKVIGQHQTVLKNLGKVYRDVEGISGATILGDGTVALILDILKLTEKEEQEERINN